MLPDTIDQIIKQGAARASAPAPMMQISKNEGVLLGFADLIAQYIGTINDLKLAVNQQNGELIATRARVAELETQNKTLDARVAELTAQLAAAQGGTAA